jgi:hypothetical protein
MPQGLGLGTAGQEEVGKMGGGCQEAAPFQGGANRGGVSTSAHTATCGQLVHGSPGLGPLQRG